MKHQDYVVVRGNLLDTQANQQFRMTVTNMLNAGYHLVGGPAMDQSGTVVIQALAKLAGKSRKK